MIWAGCMNPSDAIVVCAQPARLTRRSSQLPPSQGEPSVGATVRGAVTDASGVPLEGASVSLQRVDVPDAIAVPTSTDPDGRYEIRALGAGTYRLKVVPAPDSGLSTTYWPGVADAAAATPITLRAGQRHR